MSPGVGEEKVLCQQNSRIMMCDMRVAVALQIAFNSSLDFAVSAGRLSIAEGNTLSEAVSELNVTTDVTDGS